MKYAIIIIRSDGTFDFYSNLKSLHDNESIEICYQYMQRQIKESGYLETKEGHKLYRRLILR